MEPIAPEKPYAASGFGNSAFPASLGHECGVAGIYGPDTQDIPATLFYMLFSQQHRGQESCGIAWEETGKWHSRRDLGMVAPAHNGNISNGTVLKSRLTEDGSIFQGTADSELILHLLSRSSARDRESFLRESLTPLEGAYSLAIMHEDALIAARDPSGFRPLYLGKTKGRYFIASETCALHVLGPMEYREIAPGEVVVIDSSGESSFFLDGERPLKKCVFELIYFARPDSEVFGQSVHAARSRLGEALAEQDEGSLEADIVIPVPDSGNIAAIDYARRSGISFDFGLARSHDAGRSFILPTKDQRELAARLKLHAVPHVVTGKRVVMIDDSLVRGTTSRIIVGLLREAGASEVHLRLAAPELKWPCYFGIDIPDRDQLISNRLDPKGIAQELGADSVRFLTTDSLLAAIGDGTGYCCACFDGKHPFPPRSGGKEQA
jgi:amidophosphoribosyltransferase